MIASISFTDNPKYDFFIPIIEWAWNKLGVKCHLITPKRVTGTRIFNLIEEYRCNWELTTFECPRDKEVTYAQTGRLFIGDLYPPDEIIVTSDADMILFKLPELETDCFNIFGYDLVPEKQFPMCYAFAKAGLWAKFFNKGKSLQENLDVLFSGIECESFVANYWAADQENLWKSIVDYASINLIPRAISGTQFASHRLDRDDSYILNRLSPEIVDFHMNRPGFEEINFNIIMAILSHFNINEDFDWLCRYRIEYIKLL